MVVIETRVDGSKVQTNVDGIVIYVHPGGSYIQVICHIVLHIWVFP